ncbi:MAG: hypothetical protein ACXW2I_17605 [Burkholderiales bacterium]
MQAIAKTLEQADKIKQAEQINQRAAYVQELASSDPMKAHKALWDQYADMRLVKYHNALPDRPLY